MESTKPLVSVVMVVCNVDRFLPEAIESILTQTFRDFEFIIADFGSTDSSKEVAAKYAVRDSRIKLYEIPHTGLTEARNAGCLFAQGKYIAVMDADDVSLPDRLMLQVEFMEQHPEVGVVCGGVDVINALGKSLTSSMLSFGVVLDRPTENRDLQAELLIRCPFWEAVLMRRESFVQVGGYRPVFVQAEDYDLWMRFSERFELANLKQAVFQYRIHPGQVSVRRREQQTLCALAVRASAGARRSGAPDPLDSAKEITRELLAGLGVSEAEQQVALAADCKGWIQLMCAAGEWSTALTAAVEMLKSSDWKYIGTKARADMRLEVAKLYWKNSQFVMSIATAVRATCTRPRLTGRFVRQILRRLDLA